jgi:hypothetical protein
MFDFRLRSLVAVVLAATSLAGPAFASNEGLVFRALGFYKGVANISEDSITCEIPSVTTAVADGGFQMGFWNTFGWESVSYPDQLNPFGNPCGGWIQLQNNMRSQGINVTRVVLRMKVLGANRFRDQVPTRRGWPMACRDLQKQVLFLGARMDPAGAPTSGGSNSGQPNSVFLQLFPMMSPQALSCIRDEYAALPSADLTSLAVAFRARVFGITDAGEKIDTQTARYTLTLLHQCGNARLDNFEECDPAAPINYCVIDGENESDPPIIGTCEPPGIPTECLCVYPIQ